jgi:hypothetical protein
VLATVALLLLSFTPTYANGTRRWAVAAYRVLACALLPPGSGKSAAQLQHPAAGLALDAVRTLIASRAMMLDMLSLGLPLDLPAHLVVQLPCLAVLLCHMSTCCDLPLLANPTQRNRIAAVHAAAAAGAGMFGAPAELLGGAQAQCTSALTFVLLFWGGVLPTLAVMRWTLLSLKAAAHTEWRRQPHGLQQDSGTPSGSLDSFSSSPGGSSDTLSAQSDAAGSSEAGNGDRIEHQARAPLSGGEPGNGALPGCWLCAAAEEQRLPRWAVWLLEQAFPPVHGLPALLATVYLPLLAAACWLAACLLALAAA